MLSRLIQYRLANSNLPNIMEKFGNADLLLKILGATHFPGYGLGEVRYAPGATLGIGILGF